MILTLTNIHGNEFLLNSEFIYEVEEKIDPDEKFNSIIRTVNNRDYLVKETMSEIKEKTNSN